MKYTVHSYTLNDFDKIFTKETISVDDYIYLETEVDSFEEALAITMLAGANNDENFCNIRKEAYDRGGCFSCYGENIGNIKLWILSASKDNKSIPIHFAYFDMNGRSIIMLNQSAIPNILSMKNFWMSEKE